MDAMVVMDDLHFAIMALGWKKVCQIESSLRVTVNHFLLRHMYYSKDKLTWKRRPLHISLPKVRLRVESRHISRPNVRLRFESPQPGQPHVAGTEKHCAMDPSETHTWLTRTSRTVTTFMLCLGDLLVAGQLLVDVGHLLVDFLLHFLGATMNV